MKKFFIYFLILFFTLPVNAQETVLTGGVNYTVDSARTILLDSANHELDTNLITSHAFDPNFKENANYILTGETNIKDRELAYFSDNTYAVRMHSDPYHVYYYTSGGILLYIEEKDSTQYPHKSYKYNTQNKLVNMTFRVSKGETFIYSRDGKLIAHWVKDKAYDEHGNVIMKRKYAE